MLVYYFVPFIVSNRYLLLWVSNCHNSVTVQNRTHVYMNFFDHKDLGNHLLQLCPKVVKHPVCKKKNWTVQHVLEIKVLSRSAYDLRHIATFFICPFMQHSGTPYRKIRFLIIKGYILWRYLLVSNGVFNNCITIKQIKLINLLATDFFFQTLAHPVLKMWVIQKPNKVALWNKRHFEEKKNGDYTACLKCSVRIFVE